MDEIELKVSSPEDVTLPSSILQEDLSLEEIGALFVFAALSGVARADAELQEAVAVRMKETEFQVIARNLTQRGILAVSMEGNTATIKIKLD